MKILSETNLINNASNLARFIDAARELFPYYERGDLF